MRIIRGILFMLVVFVAFAAVGLMLLPKERIAKVASAEISKALGREVVITGDIGLSIWPVLGVKTGPVRVAGPDWDDAPLLKAEALNIGVGAAAALRREVDIRQIELVSPEINLITAKDGRVSWTFGETVEAVDGDSGSTGVTPFSLARASVTGGTVLIEDRMAGTREQITGLDAELSLPELSGPATLKASGVRGGAALSVDAKAGNARDLIAGRLTPVVASFSTGGGSARFDGRMTRGLEAAGQLSVSASNTSKFMQSLGLGAADVPRGMGQAIDMNAAFTFSGGEVVNLRGMTLNLDQNTLTGDADIRLSGARPRITAKLAAGALDFTSLAASGGSGGSESSSDTGWSKTTIDASGLAAVDAEVSLAVQSLDAGMLKLGASSLGVSLDNSRMVFKMPDATGYGGQITGEFVVNNRGGLSVGGNINVLQADVNPLLDDLMGVTRLSGKADGFVKFLGSGSNLNAIMNSLSGNGGIAMAGGTISGVDLNGLMGTGNGTKGTTVFDKLGASFTMAGGVLSNDNLSMTLPRIAATGKGVVGLGARTINYLFTPVALEANSGKDLAFPVKIYGPWSNPKILPDLSAAIDLNFKEKKEEVKQKVDDAIKQKVQEELGVTVGEGQSVEDAVKKGVEDKLKKELFKIFE
ncbi:AsmA family protein [Lentibacter sp. XHP0401]|uniref:AsmA family protein n=1 Tax=Lentibacter sp. XHP0401 TaxID=2984334 RepID=UPI0021E7AAA1|nr:AsmA family protein [Lentibacter sp. XHP0401]MCV2894105.1 AsmA family protein [Lentibacter sp. XHP0401]